MITNEAIESARQALEPLAHLIGTGSVELWRIVLRQQYVKGLITLMAACVCAGLVVYVLRVFKERNRETTTEYDALFTRGEQTVYMWMGVFFAGTLAVVLFGVSIALLVNPEYFAIKSILTFLSDVAG